MWVFSEAFLTNVDNELTRGRFKIHDKVILHLMKHGTKMLQNICQDLELIFSMVSPVFLPPVQSVLATKMLCFNRLLILEQIYRNIVMIMVFSCVLYPFSPINRCLTLAC
jgi:hypothetical protein